MKRKEAIQILQIYKDELGQRIDKADEPDVKDVYQWQMDGFDMAIEALHREEAEEKGYCHRIMPSNVEVVVRCKDCRHRDLFSCPLADNDFQKDDDFCSWGERREE